MERIGTHAVVVGASMAGLLAARVLADHYEQVTVIERDALPEGDEGRRAVPQGRHVHALLPAGQRALEELLPGLEAELLSAGAVSFEPLSEMRFVVAGHRLVSAPIGERGLSMSRPLLENQLRRRVAALPGIEIVDRCDAAGLTATSARDRITGVRVLRRAAGSAEELLEAELVVAATGRSGQVGAWIEALGYERPAEDVLNVDVGYASRYLKLGPAAAAIEPMVLLGAPPERPRALALFAQEGGRSLLTLGGYGRANRPPGDEAGLMEYAAGVAPPDVLAAIEEAEPLSDIATHGFPSNRRRRFERLKRLPTGLLVTGDALAGFNPLHAQGMSVAALEAVALRRCLADGRTGLERRFLTAAAKVVDHAWEMGLSADLSISTVDAPRPRRVRIVGAYMDRLLAAAEHDPVVARAFMFTSGMLEPPTHVLRPAIARRVLTSRLRGGRGRPRPAFTAVSRRTA